MPDFSAKKLQEIEDRKRILNDLLNNQTRYSANPYEAHIQFSNFCNMSCIMCWDGRNPPTEKTSDELLQIIGDQVASKLSVITPYSGSEPLVLSWNETREMANKNSNLLCITTNVQYLDEDLFAELKDITETLLLSIDSHIPEIMQIIRPGGNMTKVYENLKTTARLCKQHEIECIVNLVFMTYNAPHLPQTLEYLADLGIESVNVIQLMDVNGRSRSYDPLIHFSTEYIDEIRDQSVAVSRSRNIRLFWNIGNFVEYDFRLPDHVPPNDRKVLNDEFDFRMRRIFPGYCKFVVNRLRIDGQGDVAPCCYATQGELSFGNLQETPFDQIWNGDNARDLRRGMLCGDLPAYCSSCRYVDRLPPQEDMQFAYDYDEQLRNDNGYDIIDSLELISPSHVERLEAAPTFKLVNPAFEVGQIELLLSLGGESTDVIRFSPEQWASDDESVSFTLPDALFSKLTKNAGYWWNVWIRPKNEVKFIYRLAESCCLFAHEHLERIPGSTLKYAQQGELPILDLGVGKKQGWDDQNILPARPTTTNKFGNQVKKTSDQTPEQSHLIGSLASGSKSIDKHFDGNMNKPLETSAGITKHPKVLDGWVEQFVPRDNFVYVVGWLLLKQQSFEKIDVFTTATSKLLQTKQIQRPDLQKGFPSIEGAEKCGFEIKLKKKDIQLDNSEFSFDICPKVNNEIICRVPVRVPAKDVLETGIQPMRMR